MRDRDRSLREYDAGYDLHEWSPAPWSAASNDWDAGDELDPQHLYGQRRHLQQHTPLGRAYVTGYGAGGFFGGSRWSSDPAQVREREQRSPLQRDVEEWTFRIMQRGWDDQQLPAADGHPRRGPIEYQRADERIREDVSESLAEQDRLDPSEIEVSVSGGEVTLTGWVANRPDKFRAEVIAAAVRGVREIHNRLRLRGMEDLAERVAHGHS
ncbi:MAG: BON domain-containing protein [Polyangiales bacterium]